MRPEIVRVLQILATDLSPLVVATLCMFSGYYGLNRAYVDPDREAPTLLLASYMWLTGLGSCAGTPMIALSSDSKGFNAALNAAAKNFPTTRGNLLEYDDVYRNRDCYSFSCRSQV